MIDWFKENSQGVRLFLFSFLILYLELALIRFSSAEVLYLGYFSNFILISVFLGIGMGFLMVKKEIRLFRYTPQMVAFFVAFVLVTHIDATFLRENIGQLFFGHSQNSPMKLPLWFSLTLIFILSAYIFAGLAQEAALCFKDFKPLTAYSIDIGGSLAGIAVFTLHAYSGASPVEWFITAFILMAVLSYRYSLFNTLIMGVGVILFIIAAAPGHFSEWSPYQRIEVWPMKSGKRMLGYHLTANGVGHQMLKPVGTQIPIYDFPYREVKKRRGGKGYDDLLVIGAGSGSDLAHAIHYGVKTIDAVEIDPVIQKAGRLFHPERPYTDKRVRVIIDDGRAFMERTRKRYDLIIFALPDSLASLSNFANIRLESFLFTRESFQQARKLLKKDGVLVLYNYYRKAWLVHKLADMLAGCFGHQPYIKAYSKESYGMVAALAIGPKLSGPPRKQAALRPATDTWPFLYMKSPHLPPMYIWIMILFVVCGVVAVIATGHGSLGSMQSNGAFALMGAAFLLLETKSVIQFSLLFGATWLVNSLVFFAILVSVLLANLLVHKFNFKRPSILFSLLLVALVVQLLLPLNTLLSIESLPLRYLISSLLLFSPIFFANLVFGFLFKDTPRAASAFGWNIIGTMIGGALEYTSIALGYQTLTVVIIILYALCFGWTHWTLRGRRTASG